MKRCVKLIVFITLSFTVCAGTLLASETTAYFVKEGDTLFEISRKCQGDANLWPYLWAKNAKAISNPHLIYPGMKLELSKCTGHKEVIEKAKHRQTRLEPEIDKRAGVDNCVECFSREIDLAEFQRELQIPDNF